MTGRRVLVPRAVQDRPPALGDAVHAFSGRSMGTTWRVLLCGAPGWPGAVVDAGIRARLDEVVAQMSTWEPDSDLCRFNRAPADAWQALPEALCEVLACALAVAEASGGAFDPTVGPLVDAWGFGPPGARGVPAEEAVEAARARGGWRRVELDLANRRARQTGGVALDFSAIAKGHAVDRIAHWLDARGFASHLVEVGGELRGSGVKPDGQPWWVALEHPDPASGDELLVALHGLSVASSGDYRRWFEHEGVRYAHTMDPRTGRPVRHGVAAVGVLHAECMQADAWSTALGVLGEDEGRALAERLGLAARWIVREGAGWRERLSAACAEMLP